MDSKSSAADRRQVELVEFDGRGRPGKLQRGRARGRKRRLGCNRCLCGRGYLCSGWRRLGQLIEIKIETEWKPLAECWRSGRNVLGRRHWRRLRPSSWHWKFRPALEAILGGLIIDRLTSAAQFDVQRRATVVAELRASRIDVVAEEALGRDHGQRLGCKIRDDLQALPDVLAIDEPAIDNELAPRCYESYTRFAAKRTESAVEQSATRMTRKPTVLFLVEPSCHQQRIDLLGPRTPSPRCRLGTLLPCGGLGSAADDGVFDAAAGLDANAIARYRRVPPAAVARLRAARPAAGR